MVKTYRTPSVASLGGAEVMTNGLVTKHPFLEATEILWTTISLLDL